MPERPTGTVPSVVGVGIEVVTSTMVDRVVVGTLAGVFVDVAGDVVADVVEDVVDDGPAVAATVGGAEALLDTPVADGPQAASTRERPAMAGDKNRRRAVVTMI